MAAEKSNPKEVRTVTPEQDALAKRFASRFFYPLGIGAAESPVLSAISKASSSIAPIGEAFQASIDGLISTISIPFVLANAHARESQFQHFYGAALIRARKIGHRGTESGQDLEGRRQRAALDSAMAKIANVLDSASGRETIMWSSLSFIDRLSSNESLLQAGVELLLQGLVLCWSAFEVLARDAFVAYLNLYPKKSLGLLSDPVARKRFELSKVSIGTLASFDFNLSGQMGNLLAQHQDFSDIYSIKVAYRALFPTDNRLRDLLDHPDLRLLSLRRNLVVHRRGIIDEPYMTAATCAQKIGERLAVQPSWLWSHIEACCQAGAAVIDATSGQTGGP